jgi:hypothetical protein
VPAMRRECRSLRRTFISATVLTLGFVGVGSALGGADEPQGGAKIKVGCWNHIFPFEYEEPVFFEAPHRCLWFKRKAETYAEGALLGKKLKWKWNDRRAKAEGTLKVPGTGGEFAQGRVRLVQPVDSCGRTVFSRLRYRIRGPRGWSGRASPIYTCRSRPGQG